jgi:energy-coupling factor transporter ATP-binding protein EcfA2
VNKTSINATVSGGAVGVAGAQVVRIENLYVGAAASAELVKPAGPIPLCPYPGLAYFGPEDASRFFGREQAISALVAAVAKRSFTALVGASGSGKSSVVLAGLAPRLSAQCGWRSTYFRIGTEPDKNPFSALARALEPLTGERRLSYKLEEVQKLSQKLATGSISLANTIGQCRAANPGKRILLIADQFEELFTLVPDEGLRNRFIDTLIAAFHDPSLGATPTVCLVLTLRADFYNAALRYRRLADRLQDHVENLGPMTRDELREAIVKPADAVHVGYEPGLVDTILDDVERRPGSLPLLQFALREMWARLKTPQMSRADYDAIDGVDGALAKRAQTIFKDTTKGETDMQAVALFRRLFTRLVTLGEGSEDTRRIVTKQELNTDEWSLAQRLAGEENRLVVTASTNSGEDTAEVVHEALIRNWPELVNWINRDRAFLSWRNQLKGRLDDWRPDPSDIGTMLRGGPLAVAEDWIARRGDDLNEEEQAFVAAGVTLRDAEKRQAEEALKREQARLRQAKWITAGVGLIVIATGALVSYQYYVNRVLDRYLTHVEGDVKQQLSYLQDDVVRQDKKIADLALKENQVALKEEEITSDVEITHRTIDEKIHEIKNLHANLLGEFSAAELARGDIDTALRLAAIGTKEDLALQLKSDAGSASTTALAAAISKAASRFASSRPLKKSLASGIVM